jgi:hypothetical protein
MIAELLFPLLLLGGSARLGVQIARRCGETGLAGRVAIGFTAAVGWLTLGGYALSRCHWLGRPWGWLGWALAGAVLAGRTPAAAVRPARLPRWRRLALGRPYLTLALVLLAAVAAANLILVLTAAPNSFDAMLYHLARVGYYLQNGSLAPFGANNPFQEQQAKNSAILLASLLAVCGKADVLAGLPQFAAWWAGGAAVYAAARTYRARPTGAAFAAISWMLLSVAWLEATTAQNDLLIAAHGAAAFFFLRRYGQTGHRRFALLAGAAAGLAIGTKASALPLIPMLLLAAGPRVWRGRVVGLAAAGALPFILPAGYWENLERFGNPLGREVYAQTVYHGLTLPARMAATARNAARYAFDFTTVDQLPRDPGVGAALARAKAAAVRALGRHGLDLTRTDDARMAFWPERWHRPDENLSYFGPFSLVLLAGLIVAARRPALRWLALAFVLFGLGQCAAGPYDLIRGRQFLGGAALIMPAAALWSGKWCRRRQRLAAGLVAVATLAIVPSALFRNNDFLLPAAGRRAYWQMDRLEQMTGLHVSYPAQRAFAALVPPDARVASAIDGYEYPLFGPRLGRHLLPVLGRWEAGQALPSDLQWLIYAGGAPQRPDDIALGIGWYLRRLPGSTQRGPAH